jgi:hypothetical protein
VFGKKKDPLEFTNTVLRSVAAPAQRGVNEGLASTESGTAPYNPSHQSSLSIRSVVLDLVTDPSGQCGLFGDLRDTDGLLAQHVTHFGELLGDIHIDQRVPQRPTPTLDVVRRAV